MEATKLQQKNSLHYEVQKTKKLHVIESKPLRIDVFTSEYCPFCGEALQAAKSAADRLAYVSNNVEVKETLIDDNPGLIESLNIIALPMIQVGHTRVVGIPSPDDIERLVHESVLNGE
jgi:glutaredoxin